jgi:predicted DNA-binding antitoxin AbrB/MazE fold protein
MTRTLKAVYENGVFRPLEPVPFQERQQLTLTVTDAPGGEEEWLDAEFHRYCESQADDAVTLDVVRQALAPIPGSLTADFIAERDEGR